ncbi:MAG: hypothetical protein ACOYOU_09455 [Kiritimatiellia bacterium]
MKCNKLHFIKGTAAWVQRLTAPLQTAKGSAAWVQRLTAPLQTAMRNATVAALLFLLPCAVLAQGGFDENMRQAVQAALSDVSASLKSSAIGDGISISVLPIARDQGRYVEGLVKNAVTAAGKTYVEAREDPFWNEIMKEVEFDERKDDILDPATLVKFGKLKASKILIYGVVREASLSGNRVFVEIELHASSIETKQHVWGGVFAKRYYLTGDSDIQGLVRFPQEVRETLKRGLGEQAVASLGRQQAKLSALKTVAYVPLAGDIDQYATFILRDAVSQTSMNPKNLDLRTLGEARQMLRDQPVQADALLYGALRNVQQRAISRTFASTNIEVTAEVQVCIENVITREILWSDTLQARATYDTQTTNWSIWADRIHPWLAAHPLGWIVPLGILVLIIIIGMIVKAGTRVR